MQLFWNRSFSLSFSFLHQLTYRVRMSRWEAIHGRSGSILPHLILFFFSFFLFLDVWNADTIRNCWLSFQKKNKKIFIDIHQLFYPCRMAFERREMICIAQQHLQADGWRVHGLTNFLSVDYLGTRYKQKMVSKTYRIAYTYVDLLYSRSRESECHISCACVCVCGTPSLMLTPTHSCSYVDCLLSSYLWVALCVCVHVKEYPRQYWTGRVLPVPP